ncbi:MAG: hypothetical protein LBS79_00415 [Tannerella sp.]|jgi:hypothetical protein|nr:hypothetical protein [Tannerella sp.]
MVNKKAFIKRHTTFILKPAGFISGGQETDYRHPPATAKFDACIAALQQACTAAAPFLQIGYLYIILLVKKAHCGLLRAAAVNVSYQPAFLRSSPVSPQPVTLAFLQPATPPPFLPVRRYGIRLSPPNL